MKKRKTATGKTVRLNARTVEALNRYRKNLITGSNADVAAAVRRMPESEILCIALDVCNEINRTETSK